MPAYHSGYVLDASVAAKWFVRHGEDDRDRALLLRGMHAAGRLELVMPEFGLLEIANAIRFSPKAREEDGAAALDLLQDLSIRLEPLNWGILRKANAIAWAYRTAIYDAVYVALAESAGFPLLTADEALVKKMKGHSIVLRLADLEIPEV